MLCYCYVVSACSAAREALGRPRGEERGGGISCRHAHSVFYIATVEWLNCNEHAYRISSSHMASQAGGATREPCR